jgi:hypothetical protein
MTLSFLHMHLFCTEYIQHVYFFNFFYLKNVSIGLYLTPIQRKSISSRSLHLISEASLPNRVIMSFLLKECFKTSALNRVFHTFNSNPDS